jgi:hypothetical protein
VTPIKVTGEGPDAHSPRARPKSIQHAGRFEQRSFLHNLQVRAEATVRSTGLHTAYMQAAV